MMVIKNLSKILLITIVTVFAANAFAETTSEVHSEQTTIDNSKAVFDIGIFANYQQLAIGDVHFTSISNGLTIGGNGLIRSLNPYDESSFKLQFALVSGVEKIKQKSGEKSFDTSLNPSLGFDSRWTVVGSKMFRFNLLAKSNLTWFTTSDVRNVLIWDIQPAGEVSFWPIDSIRLALAAGAIYDRVSPYGNEKEINPDSKGSFGFILSPSVVFRILSTSSITISGEIFRHQAIMVGLNVEF